MHVGFRRGLESQVWVNGEWKMEKDPLKSLIDNSDHGQNKPRADPDTMLFHNSNKIVSPLSNSIFLPVIWKPQKR